MYSPRQASVISLIVLALVGVLSADVSAADPESRRFRLTYELEISELSPGDQVRAWIPEPVSDQHQSVTVVSKTLPGESRLTTEKKYGNRLNFFEHTVDTAGDLRGEIVWDIERQHVDVSDIQVETGIPDAVADLFLAANERVPVGGKSMLLIEELQIPAAPIQKGRVLFDAVARHMTYDKSRPGYGRGDAVWACDSRFGNCTDFHSLFISMARGYGLPARFEIGFSIPTDRGKQSIGGYHCWAYFGAGGKWVPVDISEGDKNPEEINEYFGKLSFDRVAFSTGRDLVLEPQQHGPPLNYLIYPYVEVNGKPLPAKQLAKRFTSESR